ncbi:MAG TPA: DNA polymerase IV [Longimicrobiales bacterium]
MTSSASDLESSAVPRRILLVDCDQFYVQCARLADPEGAGREELLLVGGRPEGRGVVTSASYGARRYGVRSAMPMARAVRLCPAARVVPVPWALCRRKGREVREVLRGFTPVVEPASIDEAYLDLTGTEALYGGASPAEVAERIRAAVLEATEIVVSIGGGTSKLVAKLAVERAKPAGVHIVEAGAEAEFLRGFALAELPGVGPTFAAELRRMGLVRVEDALPLDEGALARRLGERRARWLYRRIRGRDDRPVDPNQPTKSVSREETFPRDLDADDALETELLRLAVKLGGDLRRKGLRARTITVKIRDGDFRTRQASRTLAAPLDADRAIYAVARELLARLRNARRTGARLLGIAASQFGADAGGTQLTLFDAPAEEEVETERDRRLSRAMDAVRDRFGADAVRPGKLLDP